MSHELYASLPLAREAVDRDAGRRGRPELFDELLADEGTRILPLWNGRALMVDRTATALALLPADRVTSALVRIYLGLTLDGLPGEPAGTAVIAVVLTDAAAVELESDEERWAGLRSSASQLSDRDAGLFTEALAVANWHATFTHCPRCGTPTVGRARRLDAALFRR